MLTEIKAKAEPRSSPACPAGSISRGATPISTV